MPAQTNIPSFWGFKPKPEFSEMELALMQGGHSLEPEEKPEKYTFIKFISNDTEKQ